ncbi:MAG: acylphosphatase [bacterium]|nr:acylphosphatase [bacterium]
MVQVHLFIGGYVHSVGFRAFVKREAEKLGLTGWVRNLPAGRQALPDNRVEVLAQSSASSDQEAKEALEQLILLCRKGPFIAEVRGVSVSWEETKGTYSDFHILGTE